MDINDYLPMFLEEAREHLQELNLAVVSIEENPSDRETVDLIFRLAHTFKGMSATMGFSHIAELTHAMEDVFELLRQRTDGLEREAIDVLFECLDALSGAIEVIESEGEERIDAEPLIANLRGLVRPRSTQQRIEASGGITAPSELMEKAAGRRLLHACVRLAENTTMPAVRAFMVLQAAAEIGEVVGSAPALESVESFDGDKIELWVAGDGEPGPLEEKLRSVSDVGEVSVDESTPDAVAEQVKTVHHAVADNGKKGSSKSTVRVDAERLDMLMHMMGELVVQRGQVESLIAGLEVPGLPQAMAELARSSSALQTIVMRVRMIPVEAVFMRFPRLVRDLSTKLDKQVELVLTGSETELDRSVVEVLADPIVHLIRNSLDHGIESPGERAEAGKPETGRLEISARHAGGNVVITVADDGRGIDPKGVAGKAVERGLLAPEAAAELDVKGAVELLFAPGFSTADKTSDVSGRGVGMDVVRSTVRELGGEVSVTSQPGQGTTAQIRLPLTLAILPALLVEANGTPFAIPIDRVARTLRMSDYKLASVVGKPTLMLPDSVLPFISASEALGFGRNGHDPTHAVIVISGDRRIALGVDLLIGQRELVTRPLPKDLARKGVFAGAALLSSGEIALIVDCDNIAQAQPERVAVAAG